MKRYLKKNWENPMEYPKINSLWKREGWYFDETTKNDPLKKNAKHTLIPCDYAREEFANIKFWDVEEKIDGTNIRVIYKDGQVTFGGRTKYAQIPCHLLDYLVANFSTPSLLESVFGERSDASTEIILYGEGFGPKIQSGGYYSDNPGFCLFDVKIGHWWLDKDVIRYKIAPALGVSSPPVLMKNASIDDVITLVKRKLPSIFALNDPKHEHVMEGVMCRPNPPMLFRNGDPIIFKLKCKDFKDVGTEN
jgi:hypothetical protein